MLPPLYVYCVNFLEIKRLTSDLRRFTCVMRKNEFAFLVVKGISKVLLVGGNKITVNDGF